jgi:cystathionine gamma-synthase
MLRSETVAIHESFSPTHPPAWAPFEAAIGALEGVTTIAFGSGMAAISAVLETLLAGARVVGPAAGYAWTRSLLARYADAGGIRLVGVNTTDTAATLAACEGAALLYVETPSNPLVEIAALDELCAGAHERGAAVAVDGTFASPLLQRTLSGHSDLLLGTVTSTDHAEALRHIRAQLGALPGALEAYLALRGCTTPGLPETPATSAPRG